MTSNIQEKPSALKREHPAPQNMKFLKKFYLCKSLLPSCIWTRVPNPKPNSMNPNPKNCSILHLVKNDKLTWLSAHCLMAGLWARFRRAQEDRDSLNK
jgi:hypothetical protein